MPIWDEEWTPDTMGTLHDRVQVRVLDGPPKTRSESAYMAHQAARTKLAAAAPAMARLLLSLEWEWDMDRGIDLCPVCGNEKPWLAFDDQDGEPKGGHAPDCTWLAVMRAAGVRE